MAADGNEKAARVSAPAEGPVRSKKRPTRNFCHVCALQVLAYLGRYTHRVAIANSRLVALDDDQVAFSWRLPPEQRDKNDAVSDDADMEYAMVDATIVKVHRHGQGAKGRL
jgi:Putative transposase